MTNSLNFILYIYKESVGEWQENYSTLENTQSRSIYVGKFTPLPHEPSYGPSMEEDEEIDSHFGIFDGPLEMDLQVHEKTQRCKASNEGKKSTNKIFTSNQDSPIAIEIVKEVLNLQGGGGNGH